MAERLPDDLDTLDKVVIATNAWNQEKLQTMQSFIALWEVEKLDSKWSTMISHIPQFLDNRCNISQSFLYSPRI